MNPQEVAAKLDDKSIKILRLLLDEEQFLNAGIPATLLTSAVKKEYGWTNQTVLRRFRKLNDAGLVRLSDVDRDWPEYDRYPRPPKAIERRAEVDQIREILNHWDGRGTRSPSQLTDDLADLDHRIDTTGERLTQRIDALQSKQYYHYRYHATLDRERARRRKPALYLALGALGGYLLLLLVIVLLVPALLASVLVGGLGVILGLAFGVGGVTYLRGSPL